MNIIVFILALFFSVFTSAAPLNKLVIFGDSLSDNGNLYEFTRHQFPMSPPYYNGRFTNGQSWIELLAASSFPQDTKNHLADFAVGGAGVYDGDDDTALFTLTREIDTYLLANKNKADENSLYIIWIGTNNYLALPENVDEAVQNVVETMSRDLERLVKKGAKNFVVINIPDLGKIPAAHEFDSEILLSALSQTHNKVLQQKIEQLKISYPDLTWVYVDANEVIERIFADPETLGFTNITDTCYQEMIVKPSSKTILEMVASINPHKKANACDGFLFFDPVHPTEHAHEMMAKYVKGILDKVGIEFQ